MAQVSKLKELLDKRALLRGLQEPFIDKLKARQQLEELLSEVNDAADAIAEDVRAEIVASVLEVVVSEGDDINEGDTVVLLESMKMEIPVASPKRLRIKRLLVVAGAQVQPGTALAIGEYV